MQKIKGLLIDPFNQTVEVKTIERSLSSYYSILNCSMIQFLNIAPDINIILDEEGRFKDNQKEFFFSHYPIPLQGKAFLVGGVGEEGNSLSSELQPEDILGRIEWIDS